MDYRITLAPDTNGTLLVTFPDLPEAITYGTDEADALVHARDALETILQVYITDRRRIPTPSPGPGRRVSVPALWEAKIRLHHLMLQAGLRKADLGRRLHVHPPQIDRLLDLGHASRFDQLEEAFGVLQRRLDVTDVAMAPSRHPQRAGAKRKRSTITKSKPGSAPVPHHR